MTNEMMAALIADGEKLKSMTGEDHGPWVFEDAPLCPICDAEGVTTKCNCCGWPWKD